MKSDTERKLLAVKAETCRFVREIAEKHGLTEIELLALFAFITGVSSAINERDVWKIIEENVIAGHREAIKMLSETKVRVQ